MRLVLIGMLVDLMTFDLAMEKGGTSKEDFEECIGEFMLQFYNVQDDADSIDDISKILFTVRQEFTQTATVEQTLWSEQYERLKVINEGISVQREKFSEFNQ